MIDLGLGGGTGKTVYWNARLAHPTNTTEALRIYLTKGVPTECVAAFDLETCVGDMH